MRILHDLKDLFYLLFVKSEIGIVPANENNVIFHLSNFSILLHVLPMQPLLVDSWNFKYVYKEKDVHTLEN